MSRITAHSHVAGYSMSLQSASNRPLKNKQSQINLYIRNHPSFSENVGTGIRAHVTINGKRNVVASDNDIMNTFVSDGEAVAATSFGGMEASLPHGTQLIQCMIDKQKCRLLFVFDRQGNIKEISIPPKELGGLAGGEPGIDEAHVHIDPSVQTAINSKLPPGNTATSIANILLNEGKVIRKHPLFNPSQYLIGHKIKGKEFQLSFEFEKTDMGPKVKSVSLPATPPGTPVRTAKKMATHSPLIALAADAYITYMAGKLALKACHPPGDPTKGWQDFAIVSTLNIPRGNETNVKRNMDMLLDRFGEFIDPNSNCFQSQVRFPSNLTSGVTS